MSGVIDIARSGVWATGCLGPAAGAINKKHPPSVLGGRILATGAGSGFEPLLSYRSPVPNQEKSLRPFQPRSGYFSSPAWGGRGYFFLLFEIVKSILARA
jgi:hypothetical protein